MSNRTKKDSHMFHLRTLAAIVMVLMVGWIGYEVFGEATRYYENEDCRAVGGIPVLPSDGLDPVCISHLVVVNPHNYRIQQKR